MDDHDVWGLAPREDELVKLLSNLIHFPGDTSFPKLLPVYLWAQLSSVPFSARRKTNTLVLIACLLCSGEEDGGSIQNSVVSLAGIVGYRGRDVLQF